MTNEELTTAILESAKAIKKNIQPNELSDYITNLQQENERLKEECKRWKENHKAVCIQRDNILDNIVKDTEKRIDYKSIVEKATEYSKGNIQALENRLSTPFCNFEKVTKELSIHQNYLELLQGGKDDSNLPTN